MERKRVGKSLADQLAAAQAEEQTAIAELQLSMDALAGAQSESERARASESIAMANVAKAVASHTAAKNLLIKRRLEDVVAVHRRAAAASTQSRKPADAALDEAQRIAAAATQRLDKAGKQVKLIEDRLASAELRKCSGKRAEGSMTMSMEELLSGSYDTGDDVPDSLKGVLKYEERRRKCSANLLHCQDGPRHIVQMAWCKLRAEAAWSLSAGTSAEADTDGTSLSSSIAIDEARRLLALQRYMAPMRLLTC